MAGTAVFTAKPSDGGQVLKLSWVCTSDGSGDVSSPTITQAGDTSICKYNAPFTGVLGQIRIKPGSGGVLPTDLYDVQLRPSDDATIDFLGGLGANCSQTTTKLDVPATATNGAGIALFDDILIPYAAAVGANKSFTLTVYLWI